ncbi:Uncharacterised protein [Neisseria gonorrhoeae]|uniref:Uncharacterized protein n=1 Tax=Neisseria gonorrhoeae TaxID=485 RepID=A0A378VX26_NEIGO|nr:Uncharacterised protein [Neisseria gonorrhoeae]
MGCVSERGCFPCFLETVMQIVCYNIYEQTAYSRSCDFVQNFFLKTMKLVEKLEFIT